MDTHASPSPPSSSLRPRSLTKDDLKPNVHPYTIKINSTAALARSTSAWGLARRAVTLHPHPVPRFALRVATYSALPIHSGFPSWSRIRIAAIPRPSPLGGPCRFLHPCLPSSPPLAAHSPCILSCILPCTLFSSPFPFVSVRPSSRPYSSTHLPLPLRPTTRLIPIPIPIPISSRAYHGVPLLRSRMHPALPRTFVVAPVYPSTLYHNLPPLSSFLAGHTASPRAPIPTAPRSQCDSPILFYFRSLALPIHSTHPSILHLLTFTTHKQTQILACTLHVAHPSLSLPPLLSVSSILPLPCLHRSFLIPHPSASIFRPHTPPHS
ncbi:hypothetical protein DFH09DRAFT_1367084 [Mycena vulgaris]|nr:hypothetical protein DFH09DRAFT_1367084 [Mycena vulgaris]